MNAKTAKLLNRIAALSGGGDKSTRAAQIRSSIFRRWKNTPRKERGKLRAIYKHLLQGYGRLPAPRN